ncbi:hypothetical protein [Hymenobacter metallilatus]|uniref:Carboxypeptidase-like regulatory domain-containing protein n=1 Tax=Hymenobacter metallilatus TaxID=2493666 RepID=A0A428JBZ1_9BACT|nr:hypothetical protein [Hymenobacter metallilatus]RSK29530.1 hypothetical protein EI290_16795 [Hymenobacter metallilatus]
MMPRNSQYHVMSTADCGQIPKLPSTNTLGKPHLVSGFIHHKTERIADAQIQLTGSDIIVHSDLYGRYQINAPSNGILVVTTLSYNCKQVLVPEHDTLNIELMESM